MHTGICTRCGGPTAGWGVCGRCVERDREVAAQARADARTFPVLLGSLTRAAPQCPRQVPWSMLAPHEARAVANHGQSLQRLADRGGLDPTEILAVMEDRAWEIMPLDAAVDRLIRYVADHARKVAP